jgi:hypothetical protein
MRSRCWGREREEEALGLQGTVEGVEDHAGLDLGHLVGGVHAEDALEPGKMDDQAALAGHGPAAEAGAGATDHVGGFFGLGPGQDLLQGPGVSGQDHGFGGITVEAEAVAVIGGQGGGRAQHVLRPQQAAALLQELSA